MQESPVEKINKQLEVLWTSKNNFLIREYIPSRIDERLLTYKNDVMQNGGERSLKSQKYFNYCHQYIAFFKSKSYQFLFKDYSLGRFVYEFDEKGHLISYNLYWNPCPFSEEFISKIEKSGMDVCEYIDNMENEEKIELCDVLLRTPIRFDFDSRYDGSEKEYHPLLHIHYQDKDTRASSKKVFSVYGYYLFVLENCYPEIYKAMQYTEKIEQIRKLDAETTPWLKVVSKGQMPALGERICTEVVFGK